jgi:hypothetical protein
VPEGCPPDSEINVLVLTSSAVLYTFDPDTLRTTELGRVACMSDANSMVYSRKGYALLNDGGGSLYKAYVPSLACEKLPFDTAQVDNQRFGMGMMARNGQEKFFAVRRFGTPELITIDLQTWQAKLIAPLRGDVGGAELEGNGDGRLFSLFVNVGWTRAEIAVIDQETAEFSENVEISSVTSNITAYDFAVWRGAFYTFTSTEGTARVDRFDAQTGVTKYLGRLPFAVVGAATSTCAPI